METIVSSGYELLQLMYQDVCVMGMADFYLKVNFNNHNMVDYEAISQTFANEKIFRVLDKDSKLNSLTLECQFDNLIPCIIIAFNNLYPFRDNIVSIETYGIVKEFDFESIEEFLNFVFSSNKNKLLSYYKEMGYLYVDSDKYYKTRIKLKKYYKKLDSDTMYD